MGDMVNLSGIYALSNQAIKTMVNGMGKAAFALMDMMHRDIPKEMMACNISIYRSDTTPI